MKKLLSAAALLTAVLMIALCCAACGETSATPDEAVLPTEQVFPLTGAYRLTDGTGISEDQLAKLKEGASLVIGADNTGTLTMSGQSTECTFDPAEKKVWAAGSSVAEYTFDGTKLVINMKQSGTQVWEKTE